MENNSHNGSVMVAALLCYARHHKWTIGQIVGFLSRVAFRDLVKNHDDHTNYFDPNLVEQIFDLYKSLIQKEPPENAVEVLKNALEIDFRLYTSVLTNEFDEMLGAPKKVGEELS